MIYPNIEAIASGTISGEFRDWVKVKPEAKALLAELLKLREENARLKDLAADAEAGAKENAALLELSYRKRDSLTRERDEARAQKEKRNEEA